MKTIKSLLLVAAIAFSSVLSASTTPEEKAKTKAKAETTAISQAVEQLLQNPTFDVEKEMTAKVTLTINKNNEIVVLSVECEDETLEGYLKGKLNYQELGEDVTAGPRSYVIPVRIKTEI